MVQNDDIVGALFDFIDNGGRDFFFAGLEDIADALAVEAAADEDETVTGGGVGTGRGSNRLFSRFESSPILAVLGQFWNRLWGHSLMGREQNGRWRLSFHSWVISFYLIDMVAN